MSPSLPQCRQVVYGGLASLLAVAVLVGCGKTEPTPSAVANAASDSTMESEPSVAGDRGANGDEVNAQNAWDSQIAAVESGDSVAISYSNAVVSRQLKLLPSLSNQLLDLMLDGGGVSSSDLPSIAAIEGLFHLRIRLAAIDDDDVGLLIGKNHLSAMVPSLEILNLPHSTLGKAGISQLGKLPKLRQLRLGGEQIDDESAVAFSNIPSLESLHLIGPKITGDGLRALVRCEKLSSLYIDDCPLPDEAWETLFAAKPGLHVHVDQAHHDRDPKAHVH